MKKTVLNTVLSTVFIVTLGFGMSACSGEKEGEQGSHEVMAVDRVDEAAALARKNAPAAEEMDFPKTAPMPVAAVDGAAVDGTVTTEAGATDVATTTDAGAADANMAEATAADDSTTADVAGAADSSATATAPQ